MKQEEETKNKTILIKVNYLLQVTESQLKDYDKIDRSIDLFISDCEEKAKKINLKWESSNQIVLNENNMNCGYCSKCGCWVTDMEKPNKIMELNRGAIYQDKLYCDECLPPDHKYAF